jgi:BirA family transcriptional regulator, biotin operon repressor / biotin---[acetyl-CoA-carboxylase] ligase
MTTTLDLERALAAAGIAAPVRWDEVTGSTNETARELARSGAEEWTLVAAGHQTGGHGRLGRVWQDVPGQALMFSVVLRPGIAPQEAGLLSLLAGAAMAEVASEVSGTTILCKWPNDLLARDGEGKVAGILLESVVQDGAVREVVMGLGINLVPPQGVPGAAGLGAHVDPMTLLTAFLVRFRAGYRPGADGFPGEVVKRWSAVSATLGRDVEVTRADGTCEQGCATSLDAQGGLVIETATGPTTVVFGEVAHLS